MKLRLKPTEVPFFVGDVVLVNQPYDTSINQDPTYQGRIIQIILNGNLSSSSVVRERQEEHLIEVNSAIYDIKPIGKHSDLPRILVQVDLTRDQYVLFKNQEELEIFESHLL